jgi:NAD(P)-dependent dehydrogenase (short-subunit alcohol dehydrogenase family)
MGSQLEGQVALVTGGGTGIGRGIALVLAHEGASVMLCGRRAAPLIEVCEQAGKAGVAVRYVQADVSRAEDVERLVAETVAACGPVDILVNNAAIDGGSPIHTHDIADWDRVMAINLRGPFLLARAVLPSMRERRRGHILMISSESGIEHYPGDGAYGVSKHALNALAEYIQRENQDHGIRVDTICPGMVVTEMTRHYTDLDHARSLYPEDIADLALWLVARRPNIKIGTPVLIQTMLNPWKREDPDAADL